MFRIHFVPQIGKFVIQVSAWFGLSWHTVQNGTCPSDTTDLKFITYKDAIAHADSIGLSTLYRDKSDNRYREHMRGEQHLGL